MYVKKYKNIEFKGGNFQILIQQEIIKQCYINKDIHQVLLNIYI